MSFTNQNSLPVRFPANLTATLQAGDHQGKTQLWAPFVHEGKNYKLVITNRHWFNLPEAGEEWEMYPERSPNGHIIFCHATERTKTASGEHPVVAKTRAYVEQGTCVSIAQHYPRNGWEQKGTLKGVKVEKGVLSITLQPLRGDSTFTFMCQIRNTQGWRDLPYRRYGASCNEDGKEFRIVFWEYVRDY